MILIFSYFQYGVRSLEKTSAKLTGGSYGSKGLVRPSSLTELGVNIRKVFVMQQETFGLD